MSRKARAGVHSSHRRSHPFGTYMRKSAGRSLAEINLEMAVTRLRRLTMTAQEQQHDAERSSVRARAHFEQARAVLSASLHATHRAPRQAPR